MVTLIRCQNCKQRLSGMTRSVLDGEVVDWCPRCGKTEHPYPGVNQIQASSNALSKEQALEKGVPSFIVSRLPYSGNGQLPEGCHWLGYSAPLGEIVDSPVKRGRFLVVYQGPRDSVGCFVEEGTPHVGARTISSRVQASIYAVARGGPAKNTAPGAYVRFQEPRGTGPYVDGKVDSEIGDGVVWVTNTETGEVFPIPKSHLRPPRVEEDSSFTVGPRKTASRQAHEITEQICSDPEIQAFERHMGFSDPEEVVIEWLLGEVSPRSVDYVEHRYDMDPGMAEKFISLLERKYKSLQQESEAISSADYDASHTVKTASVNWNAVEQKVLEMDGRHFRGPGRDQRYVTFQIHRGRYEDIKSVFEALAPGYTLGHCGRKSFWVLYKGLHNPMASLIQAVVTEENMDKSSKDPGDWDGLAAWLSARKSSLISGPTNAYPDTANVLTNRINPGLFQQAVDHFVPGWNAFRAREYGYWVLERKSKPWTPETKEAVLKKQADIWDQVFQGLKMISPAVLAVGAYELLTAYETLKKAAERLANPYAPGQYYNRTNNYIASLGLTKNAFFLSEEGEESSGMPTDSIPFDQVVAFLKTVTPIVLTHAMTSKDNTILQGLSRLAVALRAAATQMRISRDIDPQDYNPMGSQHSYLAEENTYGA